MSSSRLLVGAPEAPTPRRRPSVENGGAVYGCLLHESLCRHLTFDERGKALSSSVVGCVYFMTFYFCQFIHHQMLSQNQIVWQIGTRYMSGMILPV